MATLKTAATALKALPFINATSNNSIFITPMLVGSHGIGKTQIVREVSKAFGNKDTFTIDCSQLGEGELGIPFAFKNNGERDEVRYILHYIFKSIAEIEKHYYEKAITTGFLGGKVKIERDGSNEYLVFNGEKKLIRTEEDFIRSGEQNMFKFGDELPAEIKIKLIENEEIKPQFILLDELNRADMPTMKQMMNVILERNVYGYQLPWWTQLVAAVNPSSQNSSYATNELDPAQWSRFLKIKVTADPEEWTDYALKKGLNKDLITVLAATPDIFNQRDSSTADLGDMTFDPRAWEMVSMILDRLKMAMNTKIFTPEEKEAYDMILRLLVSGKVGDVAARTFLVELNNKENRISPEEIFTLKSKEVPAEVKKKFKNSNNLRKKVYMSNVILWLENKYSEIVKNKDSSDKKKKEIFDNFMGQMKEFVAMLDSAMGLLFVKELINLKGGSKIYFTIAPAFGEDLMKFIENAKLTIELMNNEEK